MNHRKIEPAPVLGQTANAIEITYVNVTPFFGANLSYKIGKVPEDPNPSPENPSAESITDTLISGNATLTGDEYSGWGDDDEYLYQKLAEKLGLTLVTTA